GGSDVLVPTAPTPWSAGPGVGRRGLVLYLLVTFGVAWALWGLLAATGGLGRPEALVVMAVSMYAPALGTFAVWAWGGAPGPPLGLRRRGPWRWYLLVYVLVPALLVLGAALCVLVGLQRFDPTFTVLREAAERMGAPPLPVDPLQLAIMQ